MQHHAKKIVWIVTIIVGVALCSMSAAGAVGGGNTVSQIEATEVTVSPDETIQDAIDRAEVGDTITIPEGTYEESIKINKKVTLQGDGEVILDGNSLGDMNGITITGSQTTIRNINVRRFSATGISISGSDVLSRDVTIRNVVSRLNGDSGLFVATATDSSILTISNSRFTNNGGSGISGSGEFDEVSIINVELSDNSYDGVSISSKLVTAQQISANNNGGAETFSSDDPGIGLEIDGATDVTIEDITTRDNTKENILIGGEPLTRSVTIYNASIKRSEDADGLRIESATEEDSTELRNITSISNSDDGIDIRSKEVSLNDSIINDNNYDGVYLESDSVTVSNTSANNNGGARFFSGDDPGIGLEIDGATDVTIEDITTQDNTKENILIDGEPLSRSVTIYSASIKRSEDTDGLRIESATEEDSTELRNITSISNSDDGIDIRSKEVSLNDSIINDNNYDGVYLESDSVTVSNISANNNGGARFFSGDDPGIGLEIDGATDVTIKHATTTENTKENILVGGEPLSRDTTIHNVTAKASKDKSGLRITGASEDSMAVLSEITTTGNSMDGIYTESDNVSIIDSQVTGNDDTGVIFSPADRGKITNSSITGNGERSVTNQLSDVTIDASRNWWGSTAGPRDDDIEGSVDTSQPLSSPPGEQSNNDEEDNNNRNTDVPSGLAESLSEEQFEAIDDNNDGTPQLGELVTANLERINNDGMIQTPNGEAVEIGLNELVTTNIWRINNA
jgi:nitrous oxidase accessory protein NosD